MSVAADRNDPPCRNCMLSRSAHVCPCGQLATPAEHATHPDPPAGACNFDPVILMDLVAAMKWSKATGGSFARDGSQFTKWVAGYEYELSDEEILADNWESTETFIPRLTGGRWGEVSP